MLHVMAFIKAHQMVVEEEEENQESSKPLND